MRVRQVLNSGADKVFEVTMDGTLERKIIEITLH